MVGGLNYKSGAERAGACRANKRQELLASLDALNGTGFAMASYPDLDSQIDLTEFGGNDIALYRRDYVTSKPTISSRGGTAFATIYAKTPLGEIDNQDDDSFVADLRRLRRDVLAKENAGPRLSRHVASPVKTGVYKAGRQAVRRRVFGTGGTRVAGERPVTG